jgi:hypothetical protein
LNGARVDLAVEGSGLGKGASSTLRPDDCRRIDEIIEINHAISEEEGQRIYVHARRALG